MPLFIIVVRLLGRLFHRRTPISVPFVVTYVNAMQYRSYYIPLFMTFRDRHKQSVALFHDDKLSSFRRKSVTIAITAIGVVVATSSSTSILLAAGPRDCKRRVSFGWPQCRSGVTRPS
jgi:hypothetical protein